MRTRRVLPWVLYFVCAIAVLEGLGYAAYKALDLQRQRRDDQTIQRALSRMDTALSAVLAAESARPYFHYRAFHPAERAYSAMLGPIEPGEVLVPSPLLTEVPPFVRLHFEVDATGAVTSPQAPDGNLRDLAEAEYVAADDVIAAEALRLMLAQLIEARGVRLGSASVVLDDVGGSDSSQASSALERAESDTFAGRGIRAFELPSQPIPAMQQRQAPLTQRAFQPQEVILGPLAASWLRGDELVLSRDVRVGETRFRQGVWLDWPSLSVWLLGQIRDIVPEAALTPTSGDARSLTTIPVTLDARPSSSIVDELGSPLGVILVLTWFAALLAIIAIGVVLRIATGLAERRGRFVSAVTHELRTPMTSLRLYADLLASDAAKDEARRARFVATLRDESARLARIIENVLVYARLGRSNGDDGAPRPLIADAIDRVKQDQRRALEEAGLAVAVQFGEGVAERRLDADGDAVARIIGNLVENACKYARPSERNELEIRVNADGHKALITVRDWGPGIPSRERRRIFESFHRSVRDEFREDGLGLGLALARGLARQEGGALSLDDVSPGASFTVSLPLVTEP
ncbi:MAG: sensor histidine kinase [Phycisphaerales bacterium]